MAAADGVTATNNRRIVTGLLAPAAKTVRRYATASASP
jgi:hypothetical protein